MELRKNFFDPHHKKNPIHNENHESNDSNISVTVHDGHYKWMIRNQVDELYILKKRIFDFGLKKNLFDHHHKKILYITKISKITTRISH